MTTQVLFKPGHHDKSIPSVPSGRKRSLFHHTTPDTEESDRITYSILGNDSDMYTMCRVNLWVCAAGCCTFIFRVVSWKKHTNVIDGGRLMLPIDYDSD